jgi:hypothetical protein
MEHVKRRDWIVHRGLHVSTPETQALCDAVAGLIEALRRRPNVGQWHSSPIWFDEQGS